MKDIGDKIKRSGEKAANAIAELVTGKRPVIEHEPNGLKEKCSDIITKHYKKTMLEKGYAWSNDLETSPEYVDNVKNKVRHIQKSLLKTWEDLGLGQNDLLSNVPFPEFYPTPFSAPCKSQRGSHAYQYGRRLFSAGYYNANDYKKKSNKRNYDIY